MKSDTITIIALNAKKKELSKLNRNVYVNIFILSRHFFVIFTFSLFYLLSHQPMNLLHFDPL